MINLLSEEILQSLAHILFMIGIFSLIIISLRNFYVTFRSGINYVQQLHQIPCSNCAFFTGDYRLKCTVNPYGALTETAINCIDYEPNKNQKKRVLPVCGAKSKSCYSKGKNTITQNS